MIEKENFRVIFFLNSKLSCVTFFFQETLFSAFYQSIFHQLKKFECACYFDFFVTYSLIVKY